MTTANSTQALTVPPSDAPDENQGFWSKVYNGDGGFPIVQRRRRWYTALAVILVVCVGAILFRGFTLGIDFEGGTRMSMPPTGGATTSSVAEIFEEATGVAPQATQTVGSGDARSIEITSERLSEEQIRQARAALFNEFSPTDRTGEVSADAISDSTVSESWGSTITERMLLALGVFLLIVFAYITFRLERDMAFAAIICLIIDLTVVAGIYALVGFEVSPATVIGLLTILAYSLYDTVVVFDKIQENTAGLFNSTRATYAEQTNLAVNQTIMRSINTSIFSAVPIASLLVVAVGIMGVGTLKDLALVQFIGVIAGTFSSIFFAAPLLVTFKMKQKRYQDHDRRVLKARELSTNPATQDDADALQAADTDSNLDGAGSEETEVASPKKKIISPNEMPATEATDPRFGSSGQSWRPGM
ncbi:MAG TPA: protein translocase subunit SecF [Candidatus Corynebacterium gallistercoris]|uniref:Protein-export membrane protein SecF n=1 Tax=Candidatus Corynebacterium gallistercoris TaxID=2838530 RepID=A0A9D1RXD4_9CORY|nr:protein translocase subunit SecF [Candidatus Corynebacterium gallistercoris]